MDFTFKDEEMSGPNMQHKRFLDGTADVDSNSMKLLSDDWTLDSIFALNNDFLQELSELGGGKFEEPNRFSECLSPFSTGTESENDHDFLSSQTSSLSTTMETPMLSPHANYNISSSSSDSGLSSDNIEFDMNADYDILGKELLQQSMNPTEVIPTLRPDLYNQQAQSPVNETKNDLNVILKPSLPNPQIQPEKQIAFDEMQYLQPIDGKNCVELVQTVEGGNEPAMKQRKIQIVKKLSTGPVVDQNLTLNVQKPTTYETVMQASTPFVINKVNGNITGIRKVIHVKKGPNKNSILLPMSFKNGTDIRSIKIIKPSAMTTKSPKILMAASSLLQEYKKNEMMKNASTASKQTVSEPRYDDSMSEPSDNESYKFEEMFVQDDDDDFDDIVESDQGMGTEKTDYPKLMLSGEEKRLLAKEGISLPAHYPLTKHEERELKRIRRKIRNKISAQDSRKRKKEYVDGLEERVKKCTDENQTLLKRIKLLQNQNQNLISQMKKMQGLLTRSGSKTAQPATCLMVLLLSMALIAYPNMQTSDSKALVNDILMNENENAQNRRLLFDTHEKFSDVLVDEDMVNDFVSFYPKAEINDHDYAEAPKTPTAMDKKIGQLIDFDVDDAVWSPPSNYTKPVISETKTGETGHFGKIGHIEVNTIYANAKNLSETPHAKVDKKKNAFDLRLDDIPNVIKLTTTNLSPKDL